MSTQLKNYLLLNFTIHYQSNFYEVSMFRLCLLGHKIDQVGVQIVIQTGRSWYTITSNQIGQKSQSYYMTHRYMSDEITQSECLNRYLSIPIFQFEQQSPNNNISQSQSDPFRFGHQLQFCKCHKYIKSLIRVMRAYILKIHLSTI